MKRLFYLVLLALGFTATVEAASFTDFTLATYNLRQANHEDSVNGNGWGQRAPYIARLVQFHGFDIFGTQEGFFGQLQDLKRMLPKYEYIGVGRDDGKQKGEHSAIFYRTDKFQLLDHGDFWLSEDQSRPNLGWDAACIRICTWGKFKVISTGFTFVYFNLHMDHIGVVARAESAKLILKKIQSMPHNMSVILSGDFNVDQFSPSYRLLNKSGVLQDSYDKAALVYDQPGTFNEFDINGVVKGRIDHIFLTNRFSVLKYGILTDTYRVDLPELGGSSGDENKQLLKARCPSDHFPVMIEVHVQTK
ncbi:MAG: endonuclease/exonuclease/phosphatase family protein [Bacteroidota bacterium]|nr:endonuclease/exonuclease/phosphatase family protein [Bacteroidota bacterium]